MKIFTPQADNLGTDSGGRVRPPEVCMDTTQVMAYVAMVLMSGVYVIRRRSRLRSLKNQL